MEPEARRTDLPVLLLHNVDPCWEPAEIDSAREDVRRMKDALASEGHPVIELPVTSRRLDRLLAPFPPGEFIVFNWCEELPGRKKSDARVVEILESGNYTYTGSPPEVLALTWNKIAVRKELGKKGIAIPRGRVCSRQDADRWTCFPAIVKPALEHCSLGITAESVVLDRNGLQRRIAQVEAAFRQPALVEDFIDGREFHVTLWGNGNIEMLPPAEMDFSAYQDRRRRLCTYDSKFVPESEDYEKIEIRVPAVLEEEQYRRLRETALGSYRALRCRDYARIDLRLRDDRFHVLDVNPNADLSPETSMVYAARSMGISYGGLCSRLVNLAARRHPRFGKPSRTI